MNNLDFTTEETLNNEIAQARAAAAMADASEPRAQAAHYDLDLNRIVVELRSGATFLFPPELVQGLAGASPDNLNNVEVTPSGEGLHWEQLDVDMSIPALMLGIFGTKAWMAELGSRGGSVSSTAKAKAARENGKRGGRPRKTL
ncbi:DUF2442 domain-containing protein [Hassallia byssoidea VB512170]|uniref:DUF2442 domain-containing protein n=1 Tax=Hassallia byssoidea VB512170 TaxID=1304833 RepID=A0A846H8M3_9CYAN|nr:DUF2442 domain-containing protein [Hassalia byssoidea]NEU73682.1 DUF2442 domain-containing protein [Hassalia byssoidea VB512170]